MLKYKVFFCPLGPLPPKSLIGYNFVVVLWVHSFLSPLGPFFCRSLGGFSSFEVLWVHPFLGLFGPTLSMFILICMALYYNFKTNFPLM